MDRFELAQQLIRKAGAALRQCRPDRNEVARKTGHQDLVTRWDKATEQLLRKTISAAFPRDALVGEEYPRVPGSKDAVVWYLDPIDGTTNFVNEHRNYAISIGCWQGENPLFGMVLDVEEDRLYWARPGEGAWRNDAPIRVSDRETVPELPQRYAAVGTGCARRAQPGIGSPGDLPGCSRRSGCVYNHPFLSLGSQRGPYYSSGSRRRNQFSGQ